MYSITVCQRYRNFAFVTNKNNGQIAAKWLDSMENGGFVGEIFKKKTCFLMIPNDEMQKKMHA